MLAVLFDTLKVVESLTSSGFTEEQAKGSSEALKTARGTSVEDLATKSDLQILEAGINGELKPLKWMTGIVLAGVLSLIMKAFFMQ
ncbi:MAG: DUF1640 domain-containing protein [Nitrospirae bacterium]|nr:DUF1640 domain-containing protein [Nitrospirota bacterium]